MIVRRQVRRAECHAVRAGTTEKSRERNRATGAGSAADHAQHLVIVRCLLGPSGWCCCLLEQHLGPGRKAADGRSNSSRDCRVNILFRGSMKTVGRVTGQRQCAGHYVASLRHLAIVERSISVLKRYRYCRVTSIDVLLRCRDERTPRIASKRQWASHSIARKIDSLHPCCIFSAIDLPIGWTISKTSGRTGDTLITFCSRQSGRTGRTHLASGAMRSRCSGCAIVTTITLWPHWTLFRNGDDLDACHRVGPIACVNVPLKISSCNPSGRKRIRL